MVIKEVKKKVHPGMLRCENAFQNGLFTSVVVCDLHVA